MTDQKKPIREGYQPEQQPTTPSEHSVKGGYQPPTSESDNPANEPLPPKEE